MVLQEGSVSRQPGEEETTGKISVEETEEQEEQEVVVEPLNVRLLQSLEETFNSSVQAVREAVIGMDVDDLKREGGGGDENVGGGGGGGSNRSLLQSVEESIAHSVQSVEETIVQSVQTVKEAVNAATEAATAPAAGAVKKNSDEEPPGDVRHVADEAAILVHSVVQD